MAQAGSDWEVGLGRYSVGRAAGGGAEGRKRVKWRRYHSRMPISKMPSILGRYLGLTHSIRVAQILSDIERER